MFYLYKQSDWAYENLTSKKFPNNNKYFENNFTSSSLIKMNCWIFNYIFYSWSGKNEEERKTKKEPHSVEGKR